MAFVPLEARDDGASEAVQILRDFGIEYDAADHPPEGVADQTVLFALDELHRAFTKGELTNLVTHGRLRAECGPRTSCEDSRGLRRARRILGLRDFSAYEWPGLGAAYKDLTYCILSILCATGRDVDISSDTFLREPHTTLRSVRELRFFPFVETTTEHAVRAAVADTLHNATVTFLLQNEWLAAARGERIMRVLLSDTNVRHIYELNPRWSAPEALRAILVLLLENAEERLLPATEGLAKDPTLLDRMLWAVNMLAMDPQGESRDIVRNLFEQSLVFKLKMV